jgi:hypothetical protein
MVKKTYRPLSSAVDKAVDRMDMDALRDALTVRQRRFCEEYCIDFNGAAAAIRAGYSKTWADRQAHLLVKHNRGVATYIDFLTMSQAAKIMSVDADYIIKGIIDIIQKAEGKDGDKLRGYELLARLKGLFIDKQEITGKDGGPLEVEQRIQEEASDFTKMLKNMRKEKPSV